MRTPKAQPSQVPAATGRWDLINWPECQHLVTELHAGAYGRFHKALAPLEPIIDLDTFQLPRLIVVGSQHRGKSSLLESITKCPIFPRGKASFTTTTRAPICLRMEHVKDIKDTKIQISFTPRNGRKIHEQLDSQDDIVGVVQTIMDGIDKDTVESEEVKVLIRSPAMTTIEFVDLPGIVADPPQKKERTEGLVRSYLADPKNLVLCVEEATCANLDATQAVGLVNAAGRAAQTIMVLTKADLVDASVIRERLWPRVMRISREVIDKEFAGCVVVINRNHHDPRSFWEAAEHELEELTFVNRVFAKLPEMPQQMSALPPILRHNLTVPKLIAQVEAMYRTYIIDHWQNSAQALLKPKVADALQRVVSLGCPVQQLTVQEVMRAVWMQLDFAKMALLLSDESAKEDWTIFTKPDRSQALRELARDLLDHAPHTMSYMQQLKSTAAVAMDSIQGWLKDAAYLKVVEQQVHAAFTRSSDQAMRLERFVSLKDEIIRQGLQRAVPTERIMTELLTDLAPIAAMLRLNITRLRSGMGCLQDLEQAAHTGIIQEVLLPLQQGSFITCVPNTFLLEESKIDQQRRKKADEVLASLQHALHVIQNIHIQVDQANVSPAQR